MLAHIPNNHINKKRPPLGLIELGLGLISSTNKNLMELDFDMVAPSPDWEKFLDLQTGLFYFVNRGTGVTRQPEAKINSSRFELINNHQSDKDSDGSVDCLSLDLGLRLWGNANPDEVVAFRPPAALDQLFPPHSASNFQGDSNERLLSSPGCSNNDNNGKNYDNINSNGRRLVTYGCSKCMMFLIMAEDDPHCPRCGTSSDLLNIVPPYPPSS